MAVPGSAAFRWPPDSSLGWRDDVGHLEPLLVVAAFERQQMLDHDPAHVDTVTYLAIGEIVFSDRRHRDVDSCGWQPVILWPALSRVWVHPGVLARFAMQVSVLDDALAARALQFQCVVDVKNMPHQARDIPGSIAEHTGLCSHVIAAKLRGGDLLGHVLRAITRPEAAHFVLSFHCDHGKHRSVAALHVLRCLCPLAQTWEHSKRLKACAMGCNVATREDVIRLVAASLGMY